jgi:hypothetical protein
MLSNAAMQDIVSHLGGEAKLAEIGARGVFADESHVSFKLVRPNPRRVHTVTIARQPDGLYAMSCFGALTPDAFVAPLIAGADGILPENLATVLGRLTGVESLHHRHF